MSNSEKIVFLVGVILLSTSIAPMAWSEPPPFETQPILFAQDSFKIPPAEYQLPRQFDIVARNFNNTPSGWFFLLMLAWSIRNLKGVRARLVKALDLDKAGAYNKANITKGMKNRVDVAVYLTLVLLIFEVVDNSLNVLDINRTIDLIFQGFQILMSLVILGISGVTLIQQFGRWFGGRIKDGVRSTLTSGWYLLSGRYWNEKMKYLIGYYSRGGSSFAQVTIFPIIAITISMYQVFPNWVGWSVHHYI